MHYAEAST
ncbi:lysyl-tRNA synthetase domain protein, partial [Vibrio parahaemolyticus EKP-028]